MDVDYYELCLKYYMMAIYQSEIFNKEFIHNEWNEVSGKVFCE